MKRINKHIFLIVLSIIGLLATNSFGQQLSKQEAIRLALENNFGIIVAANNVEIADNNKNILNSGYLPTLTGAAGAVYNRDNVEAQFSNGDVNTLEGAESDRYNASVSLNYTLFDGLGRFYNYKRLKEQYNLSELQARETIENTILQLFTVYFEIARLSENVAVLEETLRISRERITRANYQFEYGQGTKLNVLNAEVDVANDSINLINTKQLLQNTKRDLSFLLNEELQTDFRVDTTITFINRLEVEGFLETSIENNVRILRNQSNIAINEYDVKVNKSGYLPTIGLTGTYGWNKSNNNAASFLSTVVSDGLSASINLSWNIFDGGSTITRVKNARIALENQEIQQNQIELEVRRDIANALGNYENRLKVYQIQQQNVVTNQNNFERSQERFKLGQITSIEFRQAQINLIQAYTNKTLAKYDAKLAELQLLQLTGQLLNIEF
ncbi:TolC family protein [Aquimarina brevivitae]|uniref:Outer membrane protein TolC n=1 Tax=Aquimarina brevivitae TaxID=323412 RepID=A0A4Q7PH17_9FLAO|nr:TolC family protein [Aquimarina brevivitae]RZS99826.1 outer membrane protein TolC [Aquimarina brevivitae]